MIVGTWLPKSAWMQIDPKNESLFAPLLKLHEDSGKPVALPCFPARSWKEAFIHAILSPGHTGDIFALVDAKKVMDANARDVPEDAEADYSQMFIIDLAEIANVFGVALVQEHLPDLKRVFMVKEGHEWRLVNIKTQPVIEAAMKFAEDRIKRDAPDQRTFVERRFLFTILPFFCCAQLPEKRGAPNLAEGDRKIEFESFPLLFCSRFLSDLRQRVDNWAQGSGDENTWRNLLSDALLTVTLPDNAGGKKPGRNDPCFCGSGKKFKKCHMKIFD